MTGEHRRAQRKDLFLPNEGANHDGLFAANAVGENTRDEGAEPGATSHGGDDATLRERLGSATILLGEWRTLGAIVEVAEI